MELKKSKIVFFIYFCCLSFLPHYSFTNDFSSAFSPRSSPEPQKKEKEAPRSPHSVKAGLLKVFPDYCTWPPHNTSENSNSFVIGSTEKNEVFSFFVKTIGDRLIKSKKVQILYISDYNEISKCHVLYIPETSKKKLEQIMEIVDDHPILTVSDAEGYLDKGVIIYLFPEGKNFRFSVNNTRARKSKLTLDSRMLKIAKKVL